MRQAPADRSRNAEAILWALLAAGLFALAAAMAKRAILDFHVLQILFFRQIIVLASAVPVISRDFPACLRTSQPGWHLLRLMGAFTALSCGIWAVAVLPLTTALTLGFAQVFFGVGLAALLLGEPVGRHRIGAVIAGFVGILVILRPGLDGLILPGAPIPLAGALGAAVAIIAVRRLAQTETTASLLTYQAVFVGLLAGIPLLWLWQTPDMRGLALLLAIGGTATLGQWLGIRALRLGEVSVIGPIEYTKIIYAAGFGLVFFGEIPDLFTVIGAVIISAAALSILKREARPR